MKQQTKHLLSRLSSLALTLAIIISLCCVLMPNAVSSAWNGTIAASFASGTGTQSNPYVINTESQMGYFLKQLASGVTYDGLYIQLGRNLDMTGGTWNYTHGYAFNGTFNGRGYTITADCPLFDDIGAGGSVVGLNYTTAHVQLGRTPLCDVNNGLISSCVVWADVYLYDSPTIYLGMICTTNNGTVESCGAVGSVVAKGDDYSAYAAMVCQNKGTMKGCYSAITVSAVGYGKYSGEDWDPLALRTAAESSYYNAELYTGSVLSGVGMTTADMQSQAFLDSLQGTSVPGTKWVTGEHGYPALANCSTDSAYVSGHQGENTIVYNSSGSSFYLYSTRSGATVYYTTDGSDPTTSSSRSSVSSGSSVYVSGDNVLNLVSYYSGTYGAPTRVSFISLPGSGTASDPYQIRTLLQLSTLRMYPDKHFVLKNNITCASSDFVFGGTCAGGWTPVESFSGTLDGQGYAISGLRGNLGGLTDTNTGTIQNLRMLDHRLVSGDGYGVIAASNSGTIDGCYVCSAFTLTDLPNVSAGYVDYAGGIASYNSGTISGCRVEGLVIHRGMSRYSQSYFGGICGYSGGTIKNCFVNATLLMLQNEHGDNAYIGGVVGRGYANNCRSDVRIVMRSSTDYTLYVGGIVGNDPYVGGNASACIADTVDLSLQISGYLNPPVTSYPFAGNYNNCYYLSSSQLPSDCPNLDFTANWMSSDEGLIPQNVMDADGHRWVPTSTPIDPTCTAKGDMPVKCSVCGTTDILIQQALGHKHITYTSNGDATCLEDGTKTSSCVRCGVKDTITDELSALGHAFTTYESNGDATCLEDGTKTSFCDRCFEIDTVADEGSALGHSFTSYESNGDATCLEDGTKTAVCDRCDVTDTVTDEGSATGHAYGEYVSNNDFSCTEDGTMTATCAACGETETVADEGSAPGHAYGEYISNNDFTCTVDGTKTATCAVCGETDTVTDEGSAPGHAYGDYVSNNDFTCTTDGTKTATCAACGETDTVTDEGSATGHAYSDYISNTDFTCTTDGTKTSTCANCGDAITVTDEGSATGHNFVEGVCEYCQLQEISASGTCGAKLTWVLDYNGVLTISGTGAMSSWSSGSSPWYAYKDHILSIVIEEGATTIGASAFCDLSKVTALTLPEGITTINTGALWNCSGLTELSIPASVTSIAAMPFRGCSSLSTVLVDEENTAYCADASGVVYSKDLTRLVAAPGGLTGSYAIGSDVTAIEKGAFFSCSGVNELTFSGNAPAIGANAFYGVTAKCVYPGKYDSWTEDVMQQYGGTITWEAYYPQIIASGECGDDLTWTLDSEGLLAIEGTGSTYGWHSSSRAPWWNYREQILSVKIGEGMTRLGGSAFYSCPNIVTVELPSTLTYTGSAAFWFCDSLKEITIPASVKTINDDMPFRGCVSLEFITVESGNTAYCNDASGVLYTKDMTTLVAAPCKLSGAYQIPDGVTSISQAAFFYCCELISVTMPDSVTFMDEEAFSQCTALSSVRLSKGLTTIPDSAFSNCSSLTAVDIPEGVLSISRAAFAKCSSLTELTLPDGLTTIGQCAFGYLNDPSGLKKLVIPASVTTLENQALNGLVECEIWFMGDAPATWGTSVFYGSTVTCYYPAGNATWTADVMQNYGGTITWTARAEIIASGKCGDDLTWTLDSEGVLTIEGTGDMWDTGSDELWPDYLTSIKTVTIGEGVTSVGYAAFLGCTNLTTVTMADSVTSISWFAFYNCSALTSVDMSENVTFISSQAFAGCSSLAGLTIPEGVSSIQHNTFNGCSSLTGLVIPEGVTSIGDSAFQNCSSLTELTIPDSVTSIGNGVFRGCSGLTEVYFTGSAPTFGTSVFKDVTATCYYPAAASGWTEDVMQDYGGTITWTAYTDILASGQCGDDLTWVLTDAGVLTIQGTGEMWDHESYEDVPWYDYRDSIEKAVIDAGATSIGSNAFFWYSALSEITIPDTVTSIGDYSLMDCDKITHLEIPNSVTYIGDYALSDLDGITQVVIPQNITHINAYAFSYCSNLTEITIPAAVTGMGDYAFAHCDGLTEVTIPEGVTAINEGVFWGCSGLTEVYFTGSAPTFGTSVFKDVTATCYYPAAASGWTEDVMQDYGGTITWVAVQDKFDIGFASMTMGNSLAINFAFEKASMEDWTGCYAEIRKTYADGREDVVVTVPYTEWKSANISGKAHYYVTFDGIAAKEMTDTVYVTIYNTDGTAVSTTKTDSVRDQSMRALVKEGVTDAEKTMIVDMLNYGAAAQDYFGYGADDLANAQLSEDQAAYASESVPCANNRVGTGVFKASNVILKSNIQMIFAFTGVNESNYAVVTFSNHRGQAKTINIPGSEFGTNGSLRTVTVDALVVADGRQEVTCVVYDAEGTEVGRVTDSLEFYTARNNGKDILFTRMMQYSDSAYAYFHK